MKTMIPEADKLEHWCLVEAVVKPDRSELKSNVQFFRTIFI